VVDGNMSFITAEPERLKLDLFERLPAKRRRFLESSLKKVEYKSGAAIIKQGRTGHFLGFLESGQIKLENTQKQTRVLGQGDYFGVEMLKDGRPSAHTVTTQTETVLWVLNRSDWMTPSPNSVPMRISSSTPHKKKAGWIFLVAALSLIMVLFTLGPVLLDNANNSIPDLMVEKGRPDLAEKYLRFVIHWQPESARIYGKLGDILVLQSKGVEAIEVYQQAIIMDEYLPWIHNNLGVLLLESDAADLAIEQFLKALNLNPQNIEAYRNLGNAYYTLEQWQAAANAYQFALNLDSTLMETKADWAGINLYESQLEQARQAWEEVLLENPRHLMALQGLGVISLLEEDPDQAILYLDAASYIDQDDPNTHLYLGLALEAVGKPEEAAAEYKYIVDMGSDPELFSLADTLLKVVLD
jgi:tetratricopeptide (TPR) repeat protein